MFYHYQVKKRQSHIKSKTMSLTEDGYYTWKRDKVLRQTFHRDLLVSLVWFYGAPTKFRSFFKGEGSKCPPFQKFKGANVHLIKNGENIWGANVRIPQDGLMAVLTTRW